MNLSEAKVLVTGGSTGIGYATAQLLKEKGASVFICSRTEANVQKAVSELSVKGMSIDVSNEAQVIELIQTAILEMNGLNVLINNAGIAQMAPLTETTLEGFTDIWQTNVQGAFLVAREAAKHFIKQNNGNIINIASTAAHRGFAGGTAYCASKFALSAMTQCWQAELRRHNIRVMQVNPSLVITPLIDKAGFTIENFDNKLKPTEIAHTIISMLSMENIGFITEATVWATNP